MKRGLSALVVGALATTLMSPAAHADDVPDVFGSDWADPQTAAPAVEVPDTRSCTVRIVDHVFDDSTAFSGDFTPPSACGDSWSKVVLELNGEVSGRQHDRLGQLEIGGVPVFSTSTPQPSPLGISWSVERDMTQYISLLSSPRSVTMSLDNKVDDVYDGAFDINVSLVFYATGPGAPAAEAADHVSPLNDSVNVDGATRGTLSVPRNAERLIAEVFATGAGDCEDVWYFTVPAMADYSCAARDGAYREVQVLIDGELAGIAAPYPYIFADGWSNPYLWYSMPAPRSFDLEPLRYDLTPYLGLLNDGDEHDVTIRVVGASREASSWNTPAAFQVWQDDGARVVDGGILSTETTPLRNDVTVQSGTISQAHAEAGRRHVASGWLETSHGTVMTTIDRSIGVVSTHTWGSGENPDSLRSEWVDMETRTVMSNEDQVDVTKFDRAYTVNGRMSIDDDNRLSTRITVLDKSEFLYTPSSGPERQLSTRESFIGAAAFNVDEPRTAHDGVAITQNRYRVTSDTDGTCHDRTVRSRNGHIISDESLC